MKTLLLTLAFCVSTLCAQTHYGTGCGLSDLYTTPAAIGQPWSVSISAMIGNNAPRPAMLLLGFVPLNVPLGWFQQSPCVLLVQPAFVMTTSVANSTGFFHVGTLPNDARLIGLRVYAQGILRSDLFPAPWAHEMTDGLKVTVTR